MFCNGCNLEKEERDFLLNQENCYRCVYKSKMKNVKKTAKKKEKCKICGKKIPEHERKREAYCSAECSKQGHLNSAKNFWTRKMRNKVRKRKELDNEMYSIGMQL